jgi:DNA replication licensing factor MCM3
LQTQAQADGELADTTAGLSIDAGIGDQRLRTFRSALGQLLNTPLFEDDSANLDELIAAVNRKVGSSNGGAFTKEEAVQALKKMDDLNQIM